LSQLPRVHRVQLHNVTYLQGVDPVLYLSHPEHISSLILVLIAISELIYLFLTAKAFDQLLFFYFLANYCFFNQVFLGSVGSVWLVRVAFEASRREGRHLIRIGKLN
jgi:hypothetical protein